MPRVRRASDDKVKGIKEYECSLLLGAPGVGKSTYMMDAIDDYMDAYKPHYKPPYFPRALIHDYSGSRTFKESKVNGKKIPCILKVAERYGIKDPLDVIRKVDKYGRNPIWTAYPVLRVSKQGKSFTEELTNCVIEHFKNGFTLWDEWTTYVDANPPSWQIDLGFNRRQYGLEVMYACHLLRKVPLAMAQSAAFRKIVLFDTEEEELSERDFKRFSCGSTLMKAHAMVTAAPKVDKRVQYHVIVDRKTKQLTEWLPLQGKYNRVA